MSNYPPGVSGGEWQISGPRETESRRFCKVCGSVQDGLRLDWGVSMEWECYACDTAVELADDGEDYIGGEE